MVDLTDETPARAKPPVGFVDLTEETKLPTPQPIGKFAKEENSIDLNTSTGSLPGKKLQNICNLAATNRKAEYFFFLFF